MSERENVHLKPPEQSALSMGQEEQPLTAVWGQDQSRGYQYLNVIIAVGLYSIWQEEKGRVMKM